MDVENCEGLWDQRRRTRLANPSASRTSAFTHLAILASGRRLPFLEPQSVFSAPNRSCWRKRERTSLVARARLPNEEAFLDTGTVGCLDASGIGICVHQPTS